MDDKHLNIDEWLRKAAAEQPAPDDTGMEAKQQAWSKMAALLEEEERGKPQPRIFRFRFNRAAIIIPLIAGTAVLAAVWLGPRFSGKTEKSGPASIRTEQPRKKETKSSGTDIPGITNMDTPAVIPADTPSAYIQTQPQTKPVDTSMVSAGQVAGNAGGIPAQPGPYPVGDRPAGNRDTPVSSSPAAAHTAVPATAGKGDNNNTVSARTSKGVTGKPKATGDGRLPAAGKTGKGQTALHNKVNKAAAEDTIRDNEQVAPGQTITNIRRQAAAKERKQEDTYARASGNKATDNSLHPLRTRNVFALQLPSLSDGSRGQRVPGAAGKGLNLGDGSSRWALQAGLIASPGNSYGLRVGILYVYQLNDKLYLQPQLSASYLTGQDKTFTHWSVSEQRRDSSNPSGPASYDVDSTVTPFTLKNTFAVSAGINFGYTKNRLAISTGPVYSYGSASGKKDSVRVYSSVFNDSTGLHTPLSSPAFSKGRLPGVHQLSWNIEVSYYLLPRMQAGINYRFVLLRSKGDKGFIEPVKMIQDNSLLELYIRIPLGKK